MQQRENIWLTRLKQVLSCIGKVLFLLGAALKPVDSWLQKTKWHNLSLDMILRLAVVLLMLVLIVPAMGYRWTGKDAHEILATSLLMLVFVHLLLNWRWYVWLVKTGFSARWRAITALNVILSVIFLLLLLSLGVVSTNEASLGFKFHHLCAHIFLAVMAIHLGLNWNIALGAAQKLKEITPAPLSNVLLWRGLVLLLAGYGLLFSFKKHLPPLFSLSTGRRLTLRALAFLWVMRLLLFYTQAQLTMRCAMLSGNAAAKKRWISSKVEFGEVRASASGSDVLSLNSPSGQVA